jgi:DNA polymerase-3 subunit epsilon
LTGINNKMLKNAPKFHEVAKRIIEITTDCILVAHNASFDGRILATEFKRLGYDFHRKTLCTVELSKGLIPDMESYKLGNLCKSLGIPLSGRHRADGDAMATVQLFKLLLNKDAGKEIVKAAIKSNSQKYLAPKLIAILEELPTNTGLFYLHNGKSNILYIGKGKNIKKTVNQLFLRSSEKAKVLQEKVTSVSYEETGNELIAKLKYIEEINFNKPVFNYPNRPNYSNIDFSNENLIVIDKGRKIGEKSVLLIENNEFKGFCFSNLSHQINNIEVLKKLISPMEDSVDNRNIIRKYLQKNKVEEIIRF